MVPDHSLKKEPALIILGLNAFHADFAAALVRDGSSSPPPRRNVFAV